MEKYEPSFDPYRDLKRGERRTTERASERRESPFVRIANLSSEAEDIDWINDPLLLPGDYFAGGIGFSRLTEPPIFQLKANDAHRLLDFHWFRGAAIVRKGWVELCRDLDPDAIEVIPLQIILADGRSAEGDFYLWDVVRRIDAIDWGCTKATVIKGELHGEDYLYTSQVRAIVMRPDVPEKIHLFRDRIYRTTVFCTRMIEQEAVRRNLRGFATGDLHNNPHTIREYY
jgi:hypothetical protein